MESFSKKLEGGETPTDRGRAKQERIRDAMTASDDGEDAGKTSKSNPKDKSKPDNSKAGGTQDDEPEDDPDANDDKDDDTDTGKAADDDADEEDPDADPDDDEEKDEKEDEVDDEDDDPTESDLAKEAQASLAKHGLKVRLADLPAEARPLVQKTLDHARAVVSRAMAEHTAFRAEKQKFDAEAEFRRQHPEYLIAELLEGENGADIEAKVNELLKGATSDTTKKALQVVIKDKRKEVFDGITAVAARTEKQLQRADAIDAYVQTACRNLKLDYDLVVESVLNKLTEKRESDQDVDLTQQEVDAIIGRHQRARQKLLGEKRQTDRKTEIQGRKRDRKEVSPAAKAGAGNTPAPTGKKPPTNDAEFGEYMAEKLAGSSKRK